MAEPAVTLTDYGLVIECVIIVILLLRGPAANARLAHWFVLFFLSLGLAALAGGTSHGFLFERHPRLDAIAWSVTMLAIGVVGLSTWNIGAHLISEARVAKRLAVASTLLFAVYVPVVLFIDAGFLVAILYYLPAILLLLLLLLRRYLDTGQGWILPGIAGLALAVIAAAVQQSGIVIHTPWLDHNVLYHLLQAIAIVLVYLFARNAVQYTV
jgi:Family of unknown function (DUF6962)